MDQEILTNLSIEEVEEALLGSMLIDDEAIIKVVDILKAEDFSKKENQIIYQSILDLFEKRMGIDLVTVSNRLKDKKLLDEIGGQNYLVYLIHKAPTIGNIYTYARLIKTNKAKRDLNILSRKIQELIQEGGKDASELIDEVEKQIFAIAERIYPYEFSSVASVIDSSLKRIEDLQKGLVIRGVPTGFSKLDVYLGGLQKSDLIILASRPSQGKTAFALNIARYLGVQEKIPVGIFSLEMSRDQIVDRLIALEAGVSLWRLRTGKLLKEGDVDELSLIYEAGERLKNSPIFIDDSPALTDLQIRTMARKLKHEIGELGLLVIDYLQLIRSSKNIDNRVQEVSEISKNLKELSRELEVPVIAISQLSREPEKRISSIPRLSDLRESGSIEQDADVVLFIHRPKEGMASLPSNQVNIIIAKHRNGPVGSVDLYFDPDTVSFYSIEEELQEMEYH
jgi:replicative DNA helicase